VAFWGLVGSFFFDFCKQNYLQHIFLTPLLIYFITFTVMYNKQVSQKLPLNKKPVVLENPAGHRSLATLMDW